MLFLALPVTHYAPKGKPLMGAFVELGYIVLF